MGTRARGLVLLAAACALIAVPAAAAKPKKTVVKSVDSCVDARLAIPDDGRAGDFVNEAVPTGHLPVGAKVLDADVGLRLTHAAVGELDILLVAPVGLMVPLTLGNGGSGDDFGGGATGCGASFTWFDDAAPTSIRSVGPAAAPFAGSFRPERPLATPNLTWGDGAWRFYFDDRVAGNPGVVEALTLSLTYRCFRKRKGCGPKRGLERGRRAR
jgi:subtilisin-like proprotein convertase family protein